MQRTVRLLEKMGASAIQLEDQTLPKRCGHLDGKTLVSTGEMLGKLKAAQDARTDAATVIVARTDAIAVDGFEAGMERAHAYAEAGADVLFIEALRTVEQFERAGRELGGRIPLLANMVEGGKTPLLSIGELGALGFRLAIHPGRDGAGGGACRHELPGHVASPTARPAACWTGCSTSGGSTTSSAPTAMLQDGERYKDL